MSRHRFVKQINIHDELEDDAIYDDEDDYDLTEEQEIAMNSGLAEIRRILGPESESGLTDADIKSSLYNSWFDVGQTVEWLLAQQEKARAAKERQDLAPSISSATSSSIDKDLPPLPVIPPQESPLNDPDAVIDEDWYGAGRYVHPMEHGYDQTRADMPRGPLIYQHQQYDYEQEEDLETVYSAPYRPNLSVISERTEKSEASRHWPTRQQLVALGEPRPVSVQTDLTSFRPRSIPGQLVDPNGIPPSPSPSAQQVLSIYQPAPSFITFNSRRSSTIPTPQPEMEQPLQPQDVEEGTRTPTPSQLQGLDDGAATVSLSSKSTSTIGPSKAKSKLSQLASSRASSISRRTGTSTLETTSVRTYPALRPSPDSEILSTTSTARPKGRATPSTRGSVETTTSTLPSVSTPRSSTSFHVNQAIQMALQQEQRDEVTQDIPTAKSATLSSVSTIKLPTPVFISAPLTPTVISSTSQSEKSSISKPSSLSKSRSASKPPSVSKPPSESKPPSLSKSPSIAKSPSVSGSAVELPVLSAPSPTPSSASGQPSKLALLAAKAREQKEQKELKQQQEQLNNPLIPRVRNLPHVGPKLPEAHTEYFTPIANGSTATTAITTSYQSLQSLKREPKQRESAAIPQTVPITVGEAKQSKLAIKLKRVQTAKDEQSASPAPSAVDDEEKESVPAIFIPGNESNGQRRVSASRASPSAFASLLVDEPTEHTSQDSKRKDRHNGTESQISSSSHSRPTVRSRDYDRPPSMTPRSGGFAFDSPSPDEIVLNARRGTSLAQRSTTSHAKSSSSSTRSSSLSASHSISKRTVPAKV